jgi:DNA-binding transcriptional LysR family regulator
VLLAQIESFLEVARTGSVTRAAESLSISQPTLTERIHSLEDELGAPLFHRTAGGMRLTEAGSTFLPYAERTVAAARGGARAVSDLKKGGGFLRLAVAPMVTFTVLPEALGRLRERRPRLQLSIRTMPAGEVVDAVLRNDASLGISRDLRHPDLERTPLYADDLVVIVDAGHRLANEPSVHLADLADEEFVLFDRSYTFEEFTTALFGSAGVIPHGVVTVDNVGAAVRMVRAGMGVGLVPRSGLFDPADGVRILSVAEAQPVRLDVVALRRRDAGPPSDSEQELLDLLRDAGTASRARTTPPPRAAPPRHGRH